MASIIGNVRTHLQQVQDDPAKSLDARLLDGVDGLVTGEL